MRSEDFVVRCHFGLEELMWMRAAAEWLRKVDSALARSGLHGLFGAEVPCLPPRTLNGKLESYVRKGERGDDNRGPR